MKKFVFQTELGYDEDGDPIIYIPRDIYDDNNYFLEEDGNTRWRIRVTIEKI